VNDAGGDQLLCEIVRDVALAVEFLRDVKPLPWS
jgi:hypothetical protein